MTELRSNEGLCVSATEIEPSALSPSDEVIDPTITSSAECDLCETHMVWECPRCGLTLDSYRDSADVRLFRCLCGLVHRITHAEVERWERDGFGALR